jgi:hypothetical protein
MRIRKRLKTMAIEVQGHQEINMEVSNETQVLPLLGMPAGT